MLSLSVSAMTWPERGTRYTRRQASQAVEAPKSSMATRYSGTTSRMPATTDASWAASCHASGPSRPSRRCAATIAIG